MYAKIICVVCISFCAVAGQEDKKAVQIPVLEAPIPQQESTHDIIKGLPVFKELSEAFGQMKNNVRRKIKRFLTKIIPQIPPGNVVREHFESGLYAIKLYETIHQLRPEEEVPMKIETEHVHNKLSDLKSDFHDLKEFGQRAAREAHHEALKDAVQKREDELKATINSLRGSLGIEDTNQ